MKKINYLYFILTTLMWMGVDKLLSILTPYHPAWLLLLPAYSCLYILSAPLFYIIIKGKGVKSGFITTYCMQAQWTTFWIDRSNKELAYLCMFNPFRINYLPLNTINNAKVEVHYSSDKEYIYFVNCSFDIKGKRNKIRVDTGGRGHILNTETNGKKVIEMTQKFVNLLNEGES
ncbi:MAG: hypothetical protein K2K46_10965 [Lachnospiraceae bacterium]|nr:hypothetical protein [Lachnospiraceae bacterium]